MLLNIDELIGEPKKIVFGGKEYVVTEPTLETMLRAEQMLDKGKADGRDLEAMAEIVAMMIPGLEVQKVPARALAPLFSFLMGADEKNSQTAQTPQEPTQI